MKFLSSLHGRTRLRVILAMIAVSLPLLGIVMPAWIHARTMQVPAAHAPALTETAAERGYSITDLEWNDETRSRRVPARLFWPSVDRGETVPLVVFSPGIGSSRDGYTYLGKYWAEHGIASIHLQHVGSDRSLWQGNLFSLVSRFQHAASDAEAIARVHDVRFALDRLLASPLGKHVDHERISAAGHSYGANTTLLEAGATVTRDGRILQFRDQRITAAIVISAPPFYGVDDMRPILSAITIPTLHITTEDDVIRIPGFGSGVEDRQKVFDATGSAFKVLAIYNVGSHNVFTERRYFDSLRVATAVKSDTAELSLAFLQQLRGQSTMLAGWSDRRADLIAKYVVRR